MIKKNLRKRFEISKDFSVVSLYITLSLSSQPLVPPSDPI